MDKEMDGILTVRSNDRLSNRKVSIDFSEEELQLIKYLKEKKKTTGRDIVRRILGIVEKSNG